MMDFTNKHALRFPLGSSYETMSNHKEEMSAHKAGNNEVPDIDKNIVMTIDGYKKLMGIEKTGKNLYWTSDINTELPIKIGDTGISSFVAPETISNAFLRAGQIRGDSPALRV
jgi:hypothetical protein